MKKVYQTKFGHSGNCLQAAIASLFELELEDVPDFYALSEKGFHWEDTLENWCTSRLLRYFKIYGDIALEFGYCLAVGKSVRGFTHVVVYKDGELVHDPFAPVDGYVKGIGLDKIDYIIVFAKMLS